MRTRQSPRNQEILFRALFKSKEPPPAPIVSSRCSDCANYPKGGRNRGTCTLTGKMVYGMGQQECFQARPGKIHYQPLANPADTTCPVCHNPVPISPGAVAVGCASCGSVLGVNPDGSIREQSAHIHAEQQAARPEWERFMGHPATGIMAASIDEIAEHLQNVADAEHQYHVNLNAGHFWPRGAAKPASRDEIMAHAEAQAAHLKRSKGYRTVVARYGKEFAGHVLAESRAKKRNPYGNVGDVVYWQRERDGSYKILHAGDLPGAQVIPFLQGQRDAIQGDLSASRTRQTQRKAGEKTRQVAGQAWVSRNERSLEAQHQRDLLALREALTDTIARLQTAGKRNPYGIGRVPSDVDPTAEAMARLEAAEMQAKALRPYTTRPRKIMRCRRCRQQGYRDEYPFSTAPGTGLCDDCL